MRRLGFSWVFLAVGLMGGVAFGQLQSDTVAVVIDEKDPASVEIGNYYVEKRGIPEENVVRISYGKQRPRTTWGDFKAGVFEPVMEDLSAKKLKSKINMIVLTGGIPYDVEGESATWMFFAHGVRVAKRNPYFRARRPLRAIRDFGLGRYPAVMLTALTVADAKRMIDLGVAADDTHPKGAVYFMKGVGERSVRAGQAPAAAAELDLMGIRSELLNGADLEGRRDVLGYLTGAQRVKTQNTYLSGAFAEHLTSTGGMLFSSPQMSVLEFIAAGATGTCGTVTEPLADARKFPQASFYVTYAQGFTLGETMWQSVATPYQVIFVGDPLACPFKRKSSFIEATLDEENEKDSLHFQVKADAGNDYHRVESILYSIDDGPLRVLYPAIRNDTRLTLKFFPLENDADEGKNSREIVFTGILSSEESPTVALDRLARQINNQPDFPVKAMPHFSTLQMICAPNKILSPKFECVASGVGGDAASWLPFERFCRFSESASRSAEGVIHLYNRAAADTEMILRIGQTARNVAVPQQQPPFETLQALADAFKDDPKISGTDGLAFETSSLSEKHARLTVSSHQPGPEWNDTEIEIGFPAGAGMMCLPFGRRLKMVGGIGARFGVYSLAFKPNPLSAGRRLQVSIGDKKIEVFSRGDESQEELLRRLLAEIKQIDPSIKATMERGRIMIVTSNVPPPPLAVENDSPECSAEFLGGRWAKLRTYPMDPRETPTPSPIAWLTFLRLNVGHITLDETADIDISALQPGEHEIVFYAPVNGLYHGMAEAKYTFVK